MKKVGVCSLYYRNANFGGLLQSFAMVKLVEQFGFSCEQICVEEEGFFSKIRNYLFCGKLTPAVAYQLIQKKLGRRKISAMEPDISSLIKSRAVKFSQFEEEIPHSCEVYTLSTIDRSASNYDIFICGSDQVWNWRITYPYIYTLNFVPISKKKIAYAASFGRMDIPQKVKSALQKGISRLDSVSVRESSSLKVFPQDVQRKTQVVLDPTLLLNAEQWRQEEVKVNVPERYIFCYFLGTNVQVRQFAEKIAKKYGLKIVTNPHVLGQYEKCDENFGDIRLYNAGPREFLYLIDHAELVLTDSFHACAFSLQFKKDFFVFRRDALKERGSMHSRIGDFLAMFDLSERLLECDTAEKEIQCCAPISYDKIEVILEKERKRSREFLKKALL